MYVYYARCTQLASHKLCIGSVMNMLNRDLGTGDVGVSAMWSYVTTSPTHHDQAIPILSLLLFMHVGHPYIPLFKIRRIFDLLVSPPFLILLATRVYMYSYYPKPAHLPILHPCPHCSSTVRFVIVKKN